MSPGRSRCPPSNWTPTTGRAERSSTTASQIREAFGFREATREDQARLMAWLADEVCPVEWNDVRVREALWARCRLERLEPPGRVERLIGAAQAVFEEQFCARTVARLSAGSVARLEHSSSSLTRHHGWRPGKRFHTAEGRPWAGEP